MTGYPPAVFQGSCHCGVLRVRFATSVPPSKLPLRKCTCSFCRKHGATAVTDREGRLEIRIVDPAEAVRYRFGPRTADFLICGRCGVYVAAVLSTSGGAVATLNANVLDDRAAFTQAPEPVSYDDETPQERLMRRAERWTVTTIVVGEESA
jgi:hypothetical protein